MIEKNLIAKLAESKQYYQKLEAILDDNATTDNDYNAAEKEEIILAKKIGCIESTLSEIKSARHIKPNEWTSNFLNSFLPGKTYLSDKQYQVFYNKSYNDIFFNDRRYTIDKPIKGSASVTVYDYSDLKGVIS